MATVARASVLQQRRWEPRVVGRKYLMRGRAGAERAHTVSKSAGPERACAVAERVRGCREGTGGCDSQQLNVGSCIT